MDDQTREALADKIFDVLRDNVHDLANPGAITEYILRQVDEATAWAPVTPETMPPDGLTVWTWAPNDDPDRQYALSYRRDGYWYTSGNSHTPRYWMLPDPPKGV